MTQRLTLHELAALAEAPPGANLAELARNLGRPYEAVAVAAWRMRRAGGWYCRIEWRTCPECGGLLASSGARRRIGHPPCMRARALRREAERRARLGAGGRTQWAQLSPEARAKRIAANRRTFLRDQARTREAALRHGAPWTPEEDTYLLTHANQSTRDQALALGRTFWSVQGRRRRLFRDHGPRRMHVRATDLPYSHRANGSS
jgi:hypothetical protein